MSQLSRAVTSAFAAVLVSTAAFTPCHAQGAPTAAAAAEADRKLAEAQRRLDEAAREVARLSAESGDREVRIIRVQRGPDGEMQTLDVAGDGEGRGRAVLGVSLARPDGSAAGEGVAIEAVTPGGPAATAGLQAGDRITAVNGRKVATPPEVVAVMRGVKPGERVKVDLQRDGKPRTLQVTSGAREDNVFVFRGNGEAMPPMPPLPPMPPMGAMGAMPPMPPMPGGGQQRFLHEVWDGPLGELELVELSPELGRYFGAKDGVLVVRAGGALKLQDGDVLRSIGGRAPQDGAHALRILRSYRPGEGVALEVLRDRKTLKFEAALPAESGRRRPHVGGMAVPPPPLPHVPPAPPAPAERPRQ